MMSVVIFVHIFLDIGMGKLLGLRELHAGTLYTYIVGWENNQKVFYSPEDVRRNFLR